jgi:hypothetical protein
MTLYQRAIQISHLTGLPPVHDEQTKRGTIRIVPREFAVYINKKDVPKKLRPC